MARRLTPEELSLDLRHGDSPHLKRRRAIIGLSFFSCAALGAVALYQIGILKRLPEPAAESFDTAKVNGSGEAYARLATPDAFLGLASYSVSACLAAIGPGNRSQTHPWMPIAMALKLIADAAMAGKLTVDEATKFKSFSLWSVLTAAATWTALPLAIPEALAVLTHGGGKHHA